MDGFDVVIPEDKLPELFAKCKYFEEKIGNVEMGNFEFTLFKWIAQTSVNDYLAHKLGEYVNGSFRPHKSKNDKDWLKAKGDFEYYKELHKNTSFSIIALALQKYYEEGIEPEVFINNHTDIFDFCARSNSGQTYTHQGYGNGRMFKLPKLIRYYVATKGIHIKKEVKEEIETGANDQNVQPAEYEKVVCNRLTSDTHAQHLSNVRRSWYVDKVLEIIAKINYGKKKITLKKVDPNQIKLF